MHSRLLATAASAVLVMMSVDDARAACLWGVAMAERDLASIERAAPLAADRSLPLGPGPTDWISGSEEDFAERAMLAYGSDGSAPTDAQIDAAMLEEQLAQARDGLALARTQAGLGDQAGCAEALDQALEAIDGARRAFRR